jgi:hypothetical protein
MKMPWQDRTGLAKGAVVCAVGLVVSTGLCGLNAALSSQVNGSSRFLIFTAFIESISMAVFAGALIIVGCMAIFKYVVGLFSGKHEDLE